MRDTVYLVVTRQRVDRMTKTPPQLSTGEYPVRLEVTVDPEAFRKPMLTRQVHVTDWREGLDLDDLELKEGFITEAEAQMIREQRMAALIKALEDRGYKVEPPPAPEPGEDTND